MAVANIAHAAADLAAATNPSTTFDAGSGSNRLLVVITRDPTGVVCSGVSYGGVSLTYGGAIGTYLTWWYLVAPATGSNTLAFTSAYCLLGYEASTWSDADQTTPVGTAVTATGNSTTPATGSVTVPTNGAAVGGFYHHYSSGAPSITSGTALDGFINGNGRTWGHGYRTSTGSLAWSTAYAYDWEAVGIPINVAGGGGGSTILRQMMAHCGG